MCFHANLSQPFPACVLMELDLSIDVLSRLWEASFAMLLDTVLSKTLESRLLSEEEDRLHKGA